ncbi:MAG: FMN-binding negative transcriptional regulator [Myxococcota bacterium]|jgi:transcriptional regulator|nr:FMN-binding negative transcriptional regulator [Myxococcota bacterium]
MYTPSPFAFDDAEAIAHFVAEHPFAELISSGPSGTLVSHIPMGRVPSGGLCGHLAAENPQAKIADGTPVLAVFRGPHAYVSPNDFVSEFNLPTWNYASVHCHGTIRFITDAELAWERLGEFVEIQEGTTGWKIPDEPRFRALLSAIRIFEIDEARFQGKAKFSQNKSPEDIEAVIEALEARGEADASTLMKRISRSK